MRFAVQFFMLIGLSVIAGSSSAQESKRFNDMLTQQLHQELTAKYAVLQDPQIINAQAKAIRGLYEALIEQGFTKDEALQLVAASLQRKN